MSQGIRTVQGELRAAGRRFAVVASRFNGALVQQLVEGAVDCLKRHGASDDGIELVRVPGALELPLALEALAASGRFRALIALGVVVRGETHHFDVVCAEASRGASSVATRHRIPVGFGILTCETPQQAADRAGGKAGNKGWEAALAALEMADLLDRLGPSES
jgi:6,7-dimethyl-8-ribityllumazine synthase